MLSINRSITVASVIALATVACSSPPQAQVEAAKAALQKAGAAEAGNYAPESFNAAQDAQTRLEAELKAQEGKFALARSYTEATKLAAAATQAGEKAVQDAMQAKQAAKTEASTLIVDARAAVQEAETALRSAPKGKGSKADIEALQSDLAAAKSTLTEAEGAVKSDHYRDAKAKADAAKQKAATVKTSVERAIQTQKSARRRG